MRLSKKSAALTAGFVLCLSIVTASQEAVDLGVVDRIKTEAFARSEVMEHLRQLTDVHGPRLTGSPGFEKAAQWATERLNAMNAMGPHPWEVSFSYSRALQDPVLKTWKGDPANAEKAQKVFYHRAKLNSLARQGKYNKEMEKAAA